ncbi:MAG: hypothetical protein GF329_08875 [Candidatus Lokiarchaeota archaeon]|nr:hypothetical protein [Candidatus Lokiarchaeota archaeon]
MDKNTILRAFWSIFVVFITDLILIIPTFLNFTIYWWMSLSAILMLDGLLVGLVLYGMIRHEKVKDKGQEATTFSRKMFNIVSGLLASVFIFLFDPLFSIFCLFALDFAFGMHEVVYAGLKLKMWYTDAFNALGRQSEEFKPYYASFMALISSTFIMLIEAPLLFLFRSLYAIDYRWVVFYIYTTTVLIWGVGDTAAFLTGSNYGKHKLPWNKDKSLEGLIGNCGVSVLIAFIFLGIGFFRWGIINLGSFIFVSIIIGILGGIYETLDLYVDDNLSTPILTGITLTILFNFLLALA